MATEFLLTLKIDKVGDREAIKALDDLTAKGRRVVEDVNAATGKALGDIAVAYQRGSRQVQAALEDIAQGHRQNVREMELEGQAADRLGMRQEHALAGMSRGLEMVGRTGQLTGRSLDAVVGQISQMAFAFGPGGQLVAAIGISTAAIVEMFMRTSREAKKAADAAVAEFSRIAHLDTKGQGEAASTLYSGDPYSANPNERPSIAGLQQEAARARARIAAGSSTFVGAYGVTTRSLTDDAKAATDELASVTAELKRRRTLLDSIVGPGGSLTAAGTAQAAEDQAGFETDRIKQALDARRKAIREAAKQAKVDADFIKAAVRSEVERITDTFDPKASLNDNLERANNRINGKAGAPLLAGMFPTPEETRAMVRDVDASIKDAIQHNPLFLAQEAFKKSVAALAKTMREELQRTLGDGLSAGFEAAFSGKGISGAFKSLTATVLAGLGGFMEQLGAQMIVVGVSLTALADSLLSLNGPGAIAAGVALVAAGAGLKAIAGSFGRGASGGGSGGGSSGAGLGSIIDRGVINPNSYSQTNASGIRRATSDTYNFFGANDPTAVRWLDEMQRKSNQRGSLAGA